MKHTERKAMMEQLDPDNLKGGKSAKDQAEGHYRYYCLQLLADIADSLGSLAYCYREMLEIQRSKSGIAPRSQGNGK